MTSSLLSSLADATTVRCPQRASYLGLLAYEGPSSEHARIDAIIVPTARATTLPYASDLAEQLGSPLIALSSQASDPVAIHRAARRAHRTVFAARVQTDHGLPGSRANRMLAEVQVERAPRGGDRAGTSLKRRADTSHKRNYGLALARMVGWQRVLFLDDDIAGITADQLTAAAGLVGRFGAVCLRNEGFFDNSVVCHANRDTGGQQGTFIGAGALLVPGTTTSFFPDIYNEDWFFLLEDNWMTDVAVSGSYRQAVYDPYADPGRAGEEEFGDCLAEGIYSLLDGGGEIDDAGIAFWQRFLVERADLIDGILARLATVPLRAELRERVGAALRESATSLRQITPELCVTYLSAWRHDRKSWSAYLSTLPRRVSIDEALGYLGLETWTA